MSLAILVVTDAAAFAVSFLIAYALRSVLLLPLVPNFKEIEPLPLAVLLKNGLIYGLPVIIGVLAYEKLYSKRLSFWEETHSLLKSVLISFILIMVLVFVSRSRGYQQFSRAVIIMAGLVSVLVFPMFRLAAKTFLARVRLWQKKVIIIGTNATARLVARGIRKNGMLGYDVVGYLTEDPKMAGTDICGVRVLGEISALKSTFLRLEVRDAIVALPDYSQSQLIDVLESCEDFAETIRIIPNIGGLFSLGVVVENLGDVLSLSVARNLVKPWNLLIKTVFESITATALAVLLLPVFLAVAAAIRLDSKGPVVFVQERLGRRGKVFKFFKFRSMYTDGEERLARFLKENPKAREEWEEFHKIRKGDPRVTRVGRFIRKTSLDEIPQLIHVFKGDMSLVGPRPYVPEEIAEMGKSYAFISRVKPGLTGLWQTSGRSLLTFNERLILDEHYIRNWSLWLDITILLRTAGALVRREEAF